MIILLLAFVFLVWRFLWIFGTPIWSLMLLSVDHVSLSCLKIKYEKWIPSNKKKRKKKRNFFHTEAKSIDNNKNKNRKQNLEQNDLRFVTSFVCCCCMFFFLKQCENCIYYILNWISLDGGHRVEKIIMIKWENKIRSHYTHALIRQVVGWWARVVLNSC